MKKILTGLILLCGALGAQAQPYPNKPVKIFVPFVAGGKRTRASLEVADVGFQLGNIQISNKQHEEIIMRNRRIHQVSLRKGRETIGWSLRRG